jgi:hypothetical protein
MYCQVSKYMAYAMAIYTLASIYYLARSRSVGTPFNDSLTEEQKRIKKESADVRKQLFVEGVALAAVLVYLSQPFKAC